ncbi:MAG: acyltransferase domain-containing protein, partial [Microlunatus sp.]|nr:acyltransferase domain-containing protein [Microlunatus sp.]
MRIAVMFPGQGSQYPMMGAGLYGVEPVFTGAVDRILGWFGGRGSALRDLWLSADPGETFDDVTCAQPLLWTINRALGEMVAGWARPDVYFGHSVGELVAATMAGVLDPRQATTLIQDRVERFADTPAGGMLAVAASVDQVAPLLGDGVWLAAVNGTRQLLLAGDVDHLHHADAWLQDRGITTVPSRARQAFHSPLVSDAVLASLPAWDRVQLGPPRSQLFTAYPGGVTTQAQARDPRFWAWQPALTVHFAAALTAVLDSGVDLLVEAGPGAGLSSLARRHPAVRSGRWAVVAQLPSPRPGAQLCSV